MPERARTELRELQGVIPGATRPKSPALGLTPRALLFMLRLGSDDQRATAAHGNGNGNGRNAQCDQDYRRRLGDRTDRGDRIDLDEEGPCHRSYGPACSAIIANCVIGERRAGRICVSPFIRAGPRSRQDEPVIRIRTEDHVARIGCEGQLGIGRGCPCPDRRDRETGQDSAAGYAATIRYQLRRRSETPRGSAQGRDDIRQLDALASCRKLLGIFLRRGGA